MNETLVAASLTAALSLGACSSSPADSGASPITASPGSTPASTTTTSLAEAAAETSTPAVIAPTTAADTTAPAEPSSGGNPDVTTTAGAQIGRASTGPAITNPIPWDPGTIYIDDNAPELFELDYNPADPECIAAEATATIGRGGAILLSLFVDGDHVPGTPCPGESGTNRIPLTIDEPLAGRRTYVDSSVYYGEEAAAGEQLSDQVIGLAMDEAVAVIDDAGFQYEVIPADPGERGSIFVADRINLHLTADGVVEFARPG